MRKIAFWRTVADAYRFLLGDVARLFLLSGAWLIAIAATFVATMGLVLASPLLGAFVGAVAAFVVAFGGFIAFAVAWHRAILRGETPRLALRFGRREWRFLGYTLLIGLIFGGVMLLVGLLFGGIAAALTASAGKASAVLVAAPVVAALVFWGFCARLSLALPAVAVDEPGAPLGIAWRRGKGNGIRLFLGPLVCVAPVLALQVVLELMAGAPFGPAAGRAYPVAAHASGMGQIVIGLIFILLYFVQAALTVGFLSFAYRQLAAVPGGDVMAPLPA